METRHLLTAPAPSVSNSNAPQGRRRSLTIDSSEMLDPQNSPCTSFSEKIERNRFLRPKIGSRRIRNRLVQKYGLVNISLCNVPKQHRKYFRDVFTTIIETKWRWCLLFFSMSFFISWSLFTCIYYLVAAYHGDFQHLEDSNWQPCIMNGNSLLNLFLFAFTTQTTIGYGFRYPTDACPPIVFVMCVQFLTGLVLQTLMAGVIFAKLARPIKRAATILFSKNAVICMRDGKLCLLFRVGDMRKSSLAEAHIRLQMIKKCVTMEGELLPFHQFDMNVGYDSGLDRVFVIWPITICHEIDESSPLYELSKKSLATARFEIIAILEGVVESVGSTTQARTSYLPTEILWGRRFEKLVTYQRENGEYLIDFGKFHNVYDVDIPECSAKELDEMRRSQSSQTGLLKGVSNDDLRHHPVPTLSLNDTDRLANGGGGSRLSDHRHINIESEDEEEKEDILQLEERVRRRSRMLIDEDAEALRKESFQVRRGPDLF
ncbi:Inward rectifier potassium channel irk-1 [Aphelenchoides bicaudatus]|nr:Inward rectifier potassium channel irk-1 [Aphelenchoides bicaudatus]